ncbi:hypothetical protein ACFXB3_16745 [Streptomyces sp. NPDC059447]|uniref:hypothetical protein n=1 Tax=unclassified Streptomyces TaxID=2593676 RepID=UPI00367CF1E4
MAIEDPQPSRVILPEDIQEELDKKEKKEEEKKSAEEKKKEEERKKKLSDSEKIAEDLKKYLENPPSVLDQLGGKDGLVTNLSLAALLEPMAKDIKDIHGEVVNPLSVELLQQARMDTLAAAWKKYLEGNPAAWAYFLSAAGGIFVTLVAGALLLRLGAWVTSKVPTLFTGGAGAGAGLTPAQVEELRAKLAATNPLLREYVREVRKLPRAKELSARATAVDKLNQAVGRQDNTAVNDAAAAIRSLKTALRNFDPKKIPTNHSALRKTADAVGRLDTAVRTLDKNAVKEATQALLRLKIILRNLKPSDIPKAGNMRSAARAARGLEGATRRLTGALAPLGPALRGVSTSAAATAGALGA